MSFMFDCRVLTRISDPKRKEVVGGWRRMYNEELHNLYASLDITRAIKSRKMSLVGHEKCIQNFGWKT